MRFFNGAVRMAARDLSSAGFGLPWGQSRSWTNQLPEDFDFGNGMNWISREQPVLGERDDGTVFVVLGFNSVRFFAPAGGNSYTAMYGARDTLIYDDGDDLFTLITRTGRQWTFYGLDTPGTPRGRLKSYKTPGDIEVELTYSGQQLTQASRSFESGPSETTTLKYVYQYLGGGDPNAGLLERITLRRQVNSDPEVDIKRVSYSYHTGATANGNLGDLKQVQVERWTGDAWLLESSNYYRYYTDNAMGVGFPHGLRYALGSEALLRLLLELFIADPDNATNAQLAEYADQYFEYDPTTRRVTKEAIDGGSRSFEFSYTERTPTPTEDYNVWQMKTVETRPTGGGEITVYTNYIGQVLLKQLRDGTRFWYDHYTYDADGRLIQHAEPSAVVSYDDGEPDLDVTLRTGAGLIHVWSYYATDTSPAAKGYLRFEAVQQGTNGTVRKLREYEYGTRTAGGATVRPVTKETVYRNDNNTGPISTTFSYDYFPNTVQVEQRVTTIPAVPTNQNGTNTTAQRWEYFDEFGNITFTKDERGYITAHQYDSATQALVRTIEDASTGLPSGWSALPGAHLNLTTDYTVDNEGRTIEILGPEHDVDGHTVRTATWTVYNDLAVHLTGIAPGIVHEVWTTQGFLEDSTYEVTDPAAPVTITRVDGDGRTVAQIVSERDPGASTAKLSSDEDYTDQSRWSRCTVNLYDNQSQLTSTQAYHNIPSSGAGSEGTNYDQTRFLYDAMDRQDGVRSPGGTITRTVLDVRGLPLEQWVGTNDNGFAATNFDDSGTNNLVLVTSMQYDGGNDMGDGNLTKQTQHVDSNSANDRVTDFGYDFRNRRASQTGPGPFVIGQAYDNLDRVVQVVSFGISPVQITGTQETNFDERGKVYQTLDYEVTGQTTVGNPQVDNFWYDDAGNQIKALPAGSERFTKTRFDALNRAVKQFVGYGDSDPDSVEDDTIFEQAETTYDEAANVIQVTSRRRFHNATGTGELSTPGGSQPVARVLYQASWYDEIGRVTAQADYGDNGGTALARPATAPASSDTVHVMTTGYNARGEAFQAVDPAGTQSRQEFDDAGRRVTLINNYVDGNSSNGTPDEDQTTLWTYTPDGEVATLTAKNAATGDQVTSYIYGTTTANSLVARSDLLRSVEYPGNASDKVFYEYNRQGQVTKFTDQNETVHEYSYDVRGQQTADRITAVGSGVDDAVRRIETSYTQFHAIDQVTSYDADTGGNVLNQIQFAYNGFRQVIREYQEHDGAVNTMTSPRVEYGYANGTANTTRRTSMTYPDGRVLTYNYGGAGGQGDKLSRVEALIDDNGTTHLADYTYLGLDGIVRVDSPQPDIQYNLATGSGATTYAGLDQFDLTKTCVWQGNVSGTPTDLVKLGYTYDRVGNRLTREDFVAKAQMTPQYFDEKYTYDGLYRLVDFERGQLSGGSITSRNFRQNWQELASPFDTALDATGNWTQFNQNDDGQGAWELEQSRQHNQANEITDISETAGAAWPTPAYDDAGNTTSFPQPASMTNSFTAIYDAWNRLVKVEDDSDTVGTYLYDGLNRRIAKGEFDAGALQRTRHFFYSNQWQNLEEHIVEAAGSSSSSSSSGTTSAERQYVWGLRYIDDLVLRDTPTERLYALQDALFNVVAITDDAGDVKERFVYQPYGESEELDTDFSSYSGTDYQWEYRFTGRELDLDTGLQINRMRYLHLQLGRWITRDDIGYLDGMNLYLARVAVRTTDPTGRKQYAPGQATCKKTVKGMGATPQNVYYVPRGSFRLASVSAYAGADEDFWSRIGSDAFILWKPNATSEFIDSKGCCCCTKVGFLQTVATTTKYSGAGQPVTQQSSWTIDGGIPYPYSTTVNPCASATAIQLTDSPNAPEFYRGVGRRLRALRQDFVACAVCLEGTEGYTWNAWLEYGDLPGNWRINEIVAYGCVRWGHSIHWSDADGKYKYQRYADGKSVEGNANVQVNVTNFGGSAPNANWKQGVLRRQGW